ncbi:hypothetical protein PSPTOT1_2830 [Pseudomonas syringae pv. tomato T1]|nr:hypothetical protein PSPTOT1_2830 [Pseudomonas syringae pv. tomato T1]
MATLRVFRSIRTGYLSDHFCLFIDYGDPTTSSGLPHSGARLRACIGWFEKDAPSLRPSRLLDEDSSNWISAI